MNPGPLPQRLRLGPVELDRYLAGQLAGLAYMRRLRAIEEEEERHLRELAEAWATLADETSDDDAFALAWREVAAGWSFRRGGWTQRLEPCAPFYSRDGLARRASIGLLHAAKYLAVRALMLRLDGTDFGRLRLCLGHPADHCRGCLYREHSDAEDLSDLRGGLGRNRRAAETGRAG